MNRFAALPPTPEEKAKQELLLKQIADSYESSAPAPKYEPSTIEEVQADFSYEDETEERASDPEEKDSQ